MKKELSTKGNNYSKMDGSKSQVKDCLQQSKIQIQPMETNCYFLVLQSLNVLLTSFY